MIGFFADWVEGDIVIDPTEIVDAGWFRRDDLPLIPPGISIARRLIDGWLADGRSPGPPPHPGAADRASGRRLQADARTASVAGRVGWR